MMDEDLERIVFVANLGMIPPLESVSIFISTSSELQTLPSGVVRVLLPAVCVPRVPQPSLENASSFSSHQLQMYGKPRGGLCLGLILVNAGLAEQELQVPGEWLQALPLADLQFLGGVEHVHRVYWHLSHRQGQAPLWIGEPGTREQVLPGSAAGQ